MIIKKKSQVRRFDWWNKNDFLFAGEKNNFVSYIVWPHSSKGKKNIYNQKVKKKKNDNLYVQFFKFLYFIIIIIIKRITIYIIYENSIISYVQNWLLGNKSSNSNFKNI